MKIFSGFSFEPTFKLNEVPPIYNELTEDEVIGWYQGMHKAHGNIIFRPGNPFYEKSHLDSCSLEIPTGKYKKNKYSFFKKDYKHYILDLLYKNNILESSNVDMYTEGGCHINIDLQDKYSNKIKVDFVYSLRSFILKNPSIVWMFLSPNDNLSSNLSKNFIKEKYPNWSKGDCINVKYNYNYGYASSDSNEFSVKYVELRFFMMPRDLYEFDVHFEFANKLMFYIDKHKDIKHPIKNIEKYITDLKEYTYDKSIKQMKKVCKLIDFDYQKLVNCGKEELLQERFNYGKEWLV